jgi:glycosyltransferase involved in cell wall biosynthesis
MTAVTPLVSAILPVHNRGPWIARAIESVLAQSYPAVELIVIDDGSTDDTAHILDRYGDRIVRVRGEWHNAYAARNAGIARARGGLIAFIDSDDRWWPDRLAQQIPRLDRRAVGLVYGDTVHVAGTPVALVPTGRTSFATTPPERGRVRDAFAWGNFVPTTTVLVRRQALADAGGFDARSPLGSDYAAWVAIARDHELDYCDAPVADYTVHGDGISFDLGRSLEARIAVFSRAAAGARVEAERRLLARLLFNLALHLAGACARRRTSSVPHAASLAWRTAWRNAGVTALPWTVAFAYHHSLTRAVGRPFRHRGAESEERQAT